MQPCSLGQIEQHVLEQLNIPIEIRNVSGVLSIRGEVESAQTRRAVTRLVARLAPGWRVRNEAKIREDALDSAVRGLEVLPFDEPSATLPSDEDEEAEGGFFAPTDPVVGVDEHGRIEVLGGFTPTSMSAVDVEPSVEDAVPGDEALADAIRRELREDAATTDLRVRVVVRRGVAHIRGTVSTLEDAECAESVAARVPGVVDVAEELEVSGL